MGLNGCSSAPRPPVVADDRPSERSNGGQAKAYHPGTTGHPLRPLRFGSIRKASIERFFFSLNPLRGAPSPAARAAHKSCIRNRGRHAPTSLQARDVWTLRVMPPAPAAAAAVAAGWVDGSLLMCRLMSTPHQPRIRLIPNQHSPPSPTTPHRHHPHTTYPQAGAAMEAAARCR